MILLANLQFWHLQGYAVDVSFKQDYNCYKKAAIIVTPLIMSTYKPAEGLVLVDQMPRKSTPDN